MSEPGTQPDRIGASLSREQFDAIRRLDTCTVANAIESFETRLRNEGFADSTVRCMFPQLEPMLGYAVTAKIRCSGPPPEGHAYLERTDWWNHVLAVRAPRVVIIEDVDRNPGSGAFLGEVHANILTALECIGAVTNGAVRDMPAVGAMGFHFFAQNIAVSHSYVHTVSIGDSVVVGGLRVKPGDLIHGDCHGLLSIPLEIAGAIPDAAGRIMEKERRVIEVCRGKDFSLEKLRQAVKDQG